MKFYLGSICRVTAATIISSLLVLAATATHESARAQAAPASSSSPGSTPGGTGLTGASPGGGGGGGIAIESVILAYEANLKAADLIAKRVGMRLGNDRDRRLVLLTPTDVAAFGSLQIALKQASIINARAKVLSDRIPKLCPTSTLVAGAPAKKGLPAHGPAATPAAAAGGGISSADVQTYIGILASLSAVNESVSPASGALADTALLNLVASDIPYRDLVFVPSFYPPHLATANLSKDSALGQQIDTLENTRKTLVANADASAIAGAPCDPTKPLGKALGAEVLAITTMIDTFEASVFGGQAPSVANQNGGNNNANTPGNQSTPSTNNSASSPGLFQQVLSADLLLQKLQEFTGKISTEHPRGEKRYEFALVRQLESGGSTLTRTNLFDGSRAYFSGGAVATFSLFKEDGSLECSGIAYGYRGFIAQSDIGTVGLIPPGRSIDDPKQDAPQQSTNPAQAGEYLPGIIRHASACESL